MKNLKSYETFINEKFNETLKDVAYKNVKKEDLLQDVSDEDLSTLGKELKQSFKNESEPEWVNILQNIIGDPKSKAIFTKLWDESSDKLDLKFETGKKSEAVKDLIPTQNEIDITKSLAYPLGGEVQNYNADRMGDVAATWNNYYNTDPVMINKTGIVAYETDGKSYIIDGHHRWSGVMCCNPNANIGAYVISGNSAPMEVLKATQSIITQETESSTLPKSTAAPQNNLLPGGACHSEDAIIKWAERHVNEIEKHDKDIKKKLTAIAKALTSGESSLASMKEDEVKSDLKLKFDYETAKNYSDVESSEDACKNLYSYIAKVCQTLPKCIDDAPSRESMPQTDTVQKDGKKIDIKDVIDKLAQKDIINTKS